MHAPLGVAPGAAAPGAAAPGAAAPGAAADRRAVPDVSHRTAFWREALAWRGSVTPIVVRRVLVLGLTSLVVTGLVLLVRRAAGVDLTMEVAPYELAGAILALLLVLRTNAGHDRWWEARRLWGGIVNQSRNLAIVGLAYGPADAGWRARLVRWTAAFPHASRAALRGEGTPPEVAALVGDEEVAWLERAPHLPSAVALGVGHLLREAEDRMDRFAFAQAERERAQLIDHVGGCERILKTPLPHVYAIKIRRFIVLYLLALPFGILHEVDSWWLAPLLTMMVAYPLVALDQIGIELQNPFSRRHLSHLPLDDICATIERNVLGLLDADPAGGRGQGAAPPRAAPHPATR